MSSIFFYLLPEASWDAGLSKRHGNLTFRQREVGVRCWRLDPEFCGFKNINKDELFFNGSWETLPGQLTPAAEGWPARFLYERWELGNGKCEMAHRPVTMDHRKV